MYYVRVLTSLDDNQGWPLLQFDEKTDLTWLYMKLPPAFISSVAKEKFIS